MFRTFNMGIGLVLAVARDGAAAVLAAGGELDGVVEIGEVVPGERDVELR
jgi:phosphoribosylaminoimidazole (AIR) synthetase